MSRFRQSGVENMGGECTRNETGKFFNGQITSDLECLVKKLEYDPKPSSKLLVVFKKAYQDDKIYFKILL